MAVSNKLIQLKDKDANLLYPKVITKSIPDKAITKAQLADDVVEILNSAATSANLNAVQNAVNVLNGNYSVKGSVDQKVQAAVDALVGSAPGTLNTLQKIAEEMQNPENNTATTVLDQVASKANNADLVTEVNRAKAAEKANAGNIAANAKAISDEVTRAKAAENTNSTTIAANSKAISDETARAKAAEAANASNIAALSAKVLMPQLTYDEETMS